MSQKTRSSNRQSSTPKSPKPPKLDRSRGKRGLNNHHKALLLAGFDSKIQLQHLVKGQEEEFGLVSAFQQRFICGRLIHHANLPCLLCFFWMQPTNKQSEKYKDQYAQLQNYYTSLRKASKGSEEKRQCLKDKIEKAKQYTLQLLVSGGKAQSEEDPYDPVNDPDAEEEYYTELLESEDEEEPLTAKPKKTTASTCSEPTICLLKEPPTTRIGPTTRAAALREQERPPPAAEKPPLQKKVSFTMPNATAGNNKIVAIEPEHQRKFVVGLLCVYCYPAIESFSHILPHFC